jgi:hypothetical protein
MSGTLLVGLPVGASAQATHTWLPLPFTKAVEDPDGVNDRLSEAEKFVALSVECSEQLVITKERSDQAIHTLAPSASTTEIELNDAVRDTFVGVPKLTPPSEERARKSHWQIPRLPPSTDVAAVRSNSTADPMLGESETFCGAENVVPLSFERATTISLFPPIDCVQLKNVVAGRCLAPVPEKGTPKEW